MDDLKKSGLKKDRGGGFFAAHKGGRVERGREQKCEESIGNQG
jgi:hypothetical protein